MATEIHSFGGSIRFVCDHGLYYYSVAGTDKLCGPYQDWLNVAAAAGLDGTEAPIVAANTWVEIGDVFPSTHSTKEESPG